MASAPASCVMPGAKWKLMVKPARILSQKPARSGAVSARRPRSWARQSASNSALGSISAASMVLNSTFSCASAARQASHSSRCASSPSSSSKESSLYRKAATIFSSLHISYKISKGRAHFLRGPEQAVLGSLLRGAQHVSDGAQAQALIMSHFENGPFARGQSVQNLPDSDAQLTGS